PDTMIHGNKAMKVPVIPEKARLANRRKARKPTQTTNILRLRWRFSRRCLTTSKFSTTIPSKHHYRSIETGYTRQSALIQGNCINYRPQIAAQQAASLSAGLLQALP